MDDFLDQVEGDNHSTEKVWEDLTENEKLDK